MSQSNTSEKVLHGASRDQAKQSTLDLDLLTPADWRVLRAARLQALLNSPYAFTSTYARESGLSGPEWRQLFNSAVWIVARDAKKLVGLARSVGEPKTTDAARRIHLGGADASPTWRIPRLTTRYSRDGAGEGGD
jgi:hypothetical protein